MPCRIDAIPNRGSTPAVMLRRSSLHGRAAAVLGILKSLGFERILARNDCRNRHPANAARSSPEASTWRKCSQQLAGGKQKIALQTKENRVFDP